MLSRLKTYTNKNSQNSVCTKINTQNLNSKMSTHKVRLAAQNAKGRAALNNPPVKKNGKVVQHPEITREECAANDCKDQICPTPCGPVVKETSVGNLTTGTPNNLAGAVVQLDIVTSNGQPNTQKAVMYNDAHNTDPSQQEIPAGTAFVNKPNVANILHHFEDKK